MALNFVLDTSVTPPLRNPQKLFDISRTTACRSLENAFGIQHLELPLSLKRELRNNVKYHWMRKDRFNGPRFDVYDYDFDKINFYDMTSEQFKMLMYLPKTFIPGFISDLFREDVMHIVTNYYFFTTERINVNYRVCYDCYHELKSMSDNEVWSLWGEEKRFWRLRFLDACVKEAHIYDSVVTVFQARKTYCDLCVVKPVVEFLTRDQCIERGLCKECSDEE